MRAVQTPHGADVDDAATLCRDHVAEHRLGQQDLTVEVGAGRILQLLPGSIRQGGHITTVDSVVDQNIDVAKPVKDRFG